MRQMEHGFGIDIRQLMGSPASQARRRTEREARYDIVYVVFLLIVLLAITLVIQFLSKIGWCRPASWA